MRKPLICTHIVILFVAGCFSQPTPLQVVDTPTPRKLPPTWTPQPSFITTPTETPYEQNTPTAATASAAELPVTNTGPLVPFNGLSMVNSLDGWAWGYAEDRLIIIWKTSDGGLSWNEVTPPQEVWEFEFALDSKTAWVTGCYPSEDDCQETLIKTSDGGEIWTEINNNNWHNVANYHFYNEQDGLLSGCGAAAGSWICNFQETHDGGVTWAPVEFISDHHGVPGDWPGQYQFCNICGDSFLLDQQFLVVVGGNLAQGLAEVIPLWITNDRGQSWHDQELVLPGGQYSPGWFNPHTPVFFGDRNGIAPIKLANEDRTHLAMAFYLTSDGGLTWILHSLVENLDDVEKWSAHEFVSSQDIFFICNNDLCTSHDGAKTWQRISSNLNFNYGMGEPYVHQYKFGDPTTGWALVGLDRDEVSLWRTIDGGEVWTNLEPILTMK